MAGAQRRLLTELRRSGRLPGESDAGQSDTQEYLPCVWVLIVWSWPKGFLSNGPISVSILGVPLPSPVPALFSLSLGLQALSSCLL